MILDIIPANFLIVLFLIKVIVENVIQIIFLKQMDNVLIKINFVINIIVTDSVLNVLQSIS